MNAVVNPFANAPVLPYALGREWLKQARAVWRQHYFFLFIATLCVLLARWKLDFELGGSGLSMIVLSYLSDAVVFTWVYLGLRATTQDPAQGAWSAGRRALSGHWMRVLRSSLWGLPAVLVSYVMFAMAPELIKALVLMVGVNLLGVACMLVLLMVCGFITFLLCLLPVLAGVQASRQEVMGFKAAGLWGFRALRAGWRPLSVVFVAFVTGAFVAAIALTWVIGHLPVQWYVEVPGLMSWLEYWYPLPALFLAMTSFLALLQPMVGELLAAADEDLSDEIHSQEEVAVAEKSFIGSLWERAGMAMRMACAASILLGVLYYFLLNSEDMLISLLEYAFFFYILGGWFYKNARPKQ